MSDETSLAIIEELILAHRILANEGVLDAYGHVSVRDPRPEIQWRSSSGFEVRLPLDLLKLVGCFSKQPTIRVGSSNTQEANCMYNTWRFRSQKGNSALQRHHVSGK